MVLPQFAHNLSPCLKLFVNVTEDDRNLVFVRGGLRSGWGFWWEFRGPGPLQGWRKCRGTSGFTLLALTVDLRELTLLVI